MITVVIKLDVVADELHHILGSFKDFFNKLAVNFLGDIGRIPCFNVETVEESALANPFGEGLVGQRRLFTQPGKVVSVEKLAVFVQQEGFKAFFDSLLTVENGWVEQTPVLD